MQHDPDPPIEQVRRELLRTLRRELFGRLNDARGPLDASDLDAWDPSLVARVMPYITRYRDLYFRSTIEGGEHLPEGPFMLVGAHAGGVMTLFGDGMIIHSAVYEHFQCRRPIYVMAHRLLYYVPKINRLALRLGVVEGSRRTARKVFDHGHALSVFPGGDYDVARTWRQRNRIDFHGRTGFVRMALEAGVPIVPVGTVGGHEIMVVLSSGERLVQVTGLRQLIGINALPIGLSFPWGLTTGYLPFVPLPVKIDVRFGAPLMFEPGAKERSDPGYHAYVRDRVQAAVQGLTDELVARRRANAKSKTLPRI